MDDVAVTPKFDAGTAASGMVRQSVGTNFVADEITFARPLPRKQPWRGSRRLEGLVAGSGGRLPRAFLPRSNSETQEEPSFVGGHPRRPIQPPCEPRRHR